jgi:hypothetical protein
MKPSRFDQYTTIFEYFSIGDDSLSQDECDGISDEFKNWMGGSLPCTAVLKNGKVEVSIGHFSWDSGFGLGIELFNHLSQTALSKIDKSVAFNFVETRENV